MPGSSRRPRYFRYQLQSEAFRLLLDLNPRLGRLDQGKWVPNYQEIARQGGVLPNSVRSLASGDSPLTESLMSALAGVAVLNGMSEEDARRELFQLVDLRSANVRRRLKVAA
jgi:hypothetical protein